MPYRIAKQFNFEAAHKLNNVPEDHKCGNLHGHSYKLILYFESDELDGDWIFDFAELDTFKNSHLSGIMGLDHSDLNEELDFETTAENLAKYFYDVLKKMWFPQLSKVRLWETDKAYAEYWE